MENTNVERQNKKMTKIKNEPRGFAQCSTLLPSLLRTWQEEDERERGK